MRKQFVLCIDNKGYAASLIPRKIYEVIPDKQAAQDNLIRVVDESGEDYLFDKSHFVSIDLSQEIEQVLVIRSTSRPRHGWNEQFRLMAEHGDDQLLDKPLPTRWDKTEWTW
jgi:hypothetical protein